MKKMTYREFNNLWLECGSRMAIEAKRKGNNCPYIEILIYHPQDVILKPEDFDDSYFRNWDDEITDTDMKQLSMVTSKFVKTLSQDTNLLTAGESEDAMTKIERKRHDETLKNWSTAKKVYLTGNNSGLILDKAIACEACKILNNYITWCDPFDVVKAFNLDDEFLGFMIINRQDRGHKVYPAPDILEEAEKNVRL